MPWDHYPHFTEEETEAPQAKPLAPKPCPETEWTSAVFVIFFPFFF